MHTRNMRHAVEHVPFAAGYGKGEGDAPGMCLACVGFNYRRRYPQSVRKSQTPFALQWATVRMGQTICLRSLWHLQRLISGTTQPTNGAINTIV